MKMQMKLLLIQCLCMNIGKGGHGTVNLPLELSPLSYKDKHMTCTVSKFQDYLSPPFSLTWPTLIDLKSVLRDKV